MVPELPLPLLAHEGRTREDRPEATDSWVIRLDLARPAGSLAVLLASAFAAVAVTLYRIPAATLAQWSGRHAYSRPPYPIRRRIGLRLYDRSGEPTQSL